MAIEFPGGVAQALGLHRPDAAYYFCEPFP